MKKIVFIIFFTSFVYPETINVPLDYSNIQSAINVSSHGDSILVSAGVYNENINFNGKNVIVSSVLGEDYTFIEPINYGPAVIFENGENEPAELSGFTIQNSYTAVNGGAIFIYNSSPNFKNLIIQNNLAFNMGGGIYINGGSQTFNNCRVNNNDIGDTNGGGLYCINSEYLYIDNCTFNYNHCPKNGSGMYLNDSYVIIKNTKLIGNNYQVESSNPMPNPKGGAIYSHFSQVYIYNTDIISNKSYGPGGGIYGFESEFEIYNTAICDNISLFHSQGAEGGGVCFNNSSVLFNNITLSDNLSNSFPFDSNGMLLKGSTTAQIINSIIYDNSGSEIILDNNACVILDYTNIMGEINGISGPNSECAEYGLNNINNNPLFVDQNNQDYTLQVNSPCIDSGTSDSNGDGIQDITNYFGSNPDMGAYEWFPYILGDLNQDGVLDILDIVSIINLILSSDYAQIADVNEDGFVDILDIIIIINILMGGLP